MVDSDVAVPEATCRVTERDSPSASDVVVTPVTSHGWRVSDGRLPARDPLRLMAFIERRGDVFEVLQLGSGFEWREFASMDAAFGFVIETGPRLAQSRMAGHLEQRC